MTGEPKPSSILCEPCVGMAFFSASGNEQWELLPETSPAASPGNKGDLCVKWTSDSVIQSVFM